MDELFTRPTSKGRFQCTTKNTSIFILCWFFFSLHRLIFNLRRAEWTLQTRSSIIQIAEMARLRSNQFAQEISQSFASRRFGLVQSSPIRNITILTIVQIEGESIGTVRLEEDDERKWRLRSERDLLEWRRGVWVDREDWRCERNGSTSLALHRFDVLSVRFVVPVWRRRMKRSNIATSFTFSSLDLRSNSIRSFNRSMSFSNR